MTSKPQQNKGRKPKGNPKPNHRKESVATTLETKTPFVPISKTVVGMIYYDYAKTLSGGMGALPTHFYSCNGLFDPDVTGVGHQPIGFDQASAFYEQWTVLRANIKVTFASAGEHARVGIFVNPDTTVPGLPRIVENGLMKMAVLGGPSTSNGRYAFATLEMSVEIPKYFGKTRGQIIADPQMYGTIASNPTEQVYFGVCAWAGFDGSADVTVGYDVVITYDSYWWEPKKLSSS